tara:strand:- start:181 stop:522 length:342 start_codon:yes stop_codon:yes gene_type:complete
MKLIYLGKKLSWESPELVILRLLKDQLLSIYSDTETELDGLNNAQLIGLLKSVSKKVENIDKIMDQELDRLIKRDSDVFKDHRCSHCESDKIFVCDPCMDKWSDEVERVALNG